MRNSNEDSEKNSRKSKKSIKRLRTSSIKISEESQKSKNFQSKNTIKEFEKLLITQQENLHKSQSNFYGSKQIKSGNR
jgi:DNA phosphorothioation-dependent restriction protein DptG